MQVIPDGRDCNPILNSSFTMKPKVLTRLGKLISLSQQIFPVHSGPSRKKILCKSLSIFIIQACLCLSVLIFGFREPKTTFKGLVQLMVEEDMKLAQREKTLAEANLS